MTRKKGNKKSETELAILNDKQALVTFEYGDDDQGAGFENVTSDDLTIPMIKLCQGQTPEVMDEEHPARIGDWINSVTLETYPREKGFVLIASRTEHVFAKWISRDDGGGFRGHYETNDLVVIKAVSESTQFGKYEIDHKVIDDKGKTKVVTMVLKETFYVFGIIEQQNGVLCHVCIPMTGTKIPEYKRWMTVLKQCDPRIPLYAHTTRIGSKIDKNDAGTFSVPVMRAAHADGVMSSLLPKTDTRFIAAKALRQTLIDGDAKVHYEGQDNNTGPDKDGDVPF